MKKFLALIPAAILLIGVSTAYADSAVKVGVVDLPQVIQNSPQVSAINQKLKTQFSSQQQKIVAQQNKLRDESSKLDPNATKKLSADDQKKVQAQVNADQKQLQDMVIAFQNDVSKAQQKEVANFMSEVNSTVQSIAKKDGLDMVLLKPAVLYSPNTVDITSEVLAALPKS